MTRTLDLTDPATGEVFGTSPIASQSDVDAVLESAAQAFAVWPCCWLASPRSSCPRGRSPC